MTDNQETIELLRTAIKEAEKAIRVWEGMILFLQSNEVKPIIH